MILRDSISVKEVTAPNFDAPFHYHKAYEIILVKGEGKRIIGNHIGQYSDDDLILMGPGLPHIWYREPNKDEEKADDKVMAMVIYIHPDWLKNNFLSSPQFKKLEELLVLMERGLAVQGTVKKQIIEKVKKISESDGLRRIIELLGILELLVENPQYDCLASINFRNSFNPKNGFRIAKVFDFVKDNFYKDIKVGEVAKFCNMTTTAFCKYFKLHTQKTFIQFLNEFRIGHACKLLLNEDLSVAQIYLACGFNNAANFNKRFKQLMKLSPSDYRNSSVQ